MALWRLTKTKSVCTYKEERISCLYYKRRGVSNQKVLLSQQSHIFVSVVAKDGKTPIWTREQMMQYQTLSHRAEQELKRFVLTE
ncbi:MAG: hypothetical protein C0507_09815 [Cyanobacteria bacterium PR.3.49]|nr:hypothetical protein [Cyanobacteria bacterium PR.3.49]